MMLKQGSFINKKYYKLFSASLLGSLAMGVNGMLDAILSGNMIGETALAAVSIVAPLMGVVYCFSSLTSQGYATLYGINNGKFEKEKAYKIAGQSILTSLGIGFTVSLLLLLFKKTFLNYYECTGELYENASAYYNCVILLMCIQPLVQGASYFVSTDGDSLMQTTGSIAGIAVNVCLSPVLCRKYGVAGLGLGTCLGMAINMVICSLHLLRKTNSIHIRFAFSIKDFFTAIKLSSSIFCAFMFIALVDLIMNKVILTYCGIAMVAAYSIINLVYSFYDSFSAVSMPAQGFTSTFLGENNNEGIRRIMKTAIKTVTGLALAISVLLVIFAPGLPVLYGMTSPELIEASTKAARIMAILSVPYGIAYVLECVYPTFGKVKLAVLMTFLNDFFCPLAVSIPLCMIFGFTGVAVGMSTHAYLVLGLFTLIMIKKYGRKDFPLYLEDSGEENVSFDLVVNEQSIVEIRDAVKAELDKRGYEIENIELLIEELYKRIYEKNPGKKVMSECTLLFGQDYVRIIVRDEGVTFNFVDENNKIESLNAHVLNSLLEQTRNKEYILTTSFNRNGFVFEK